LKFSPHIFQNNQILNIIKIRPMKVEFFNADGQTDA